jgi:hypothetical protein
MTASSSSNEQIVWQSPPINLDNAAIVDTSSDSDLEQKQKVCSICNKPNDNVRYNNHDGSSDKVCTNCYGKRRYAKNKKVDLRGLKLRVNKRHQQELTFVKPKVVITTEKEQQQRPKAKIKRIYGVINIEIETDQRWCSICGDGSMKRIQRINSRYFGTSLSTPMMKLMLPKETVWLCYECIQHMKKSLVGCMASNDNKNNLLKSALGRISPPANQPWRSGADTCYVYPEDSEKEIVVRDFTKVVRKRLTRVQETERDRQKRLAKKTKKEVKRERRYKKDLKRGYAIHGGQRFMVF